MAMANREYLTVCNFSITSVKFQITKTIDGSGTSNNELAAIYLDGGSKPGAES
jgi:hypothetical protein